MIEPDSTRAFFEGLVIPAVLAAFGGIARVCRFGVKSWKQFGGSIVISAFTGVVVHLVLAETSISSSLQAAIVAASGYSGGAILDAFVSGIMARMQRAAIGKD